MEEVVFQQDKFRFYGSCATGILALLGALYSEIWVFWLLFGASLLLSYRHYQDLQKRIVVSKEGITDEGGQFYAWKDIDHCYLENPNLVLVFKKKKLGGTRPQLSHLSLRLQCQPEGIGRNHQPPLRKAPFCSEDF